MFRAQKTGTKEWVYSTTQSFDCDIIADTLSSTTGGRDVKNEPIFVGDVLLSPDRDWFGDVHLNDKGEVVVDYTTILFQINDWYVAKSQIVGNIWDNPDMTGKRARTPYKNHRF